MDYDDELRRSCEKTGDLLHKRKKVDKCDFDGEIDEFEAEMETELDEIYTNATSNWIGTDENQPGPSGSSTEKPDLPEENYDKGRILIIISINPSNNRSKIFFINDNFF